ncbi:MAG: DUF881 domain-containing protein [Clostridia bacterium]|nr:DUF881 domain-containing protein [Clostridia bacterium]
MKKLKKLDGVNVTVCIVCFLLALCYTVQVRTISISESDILRLKRENELRDEIEQWKVVHEEQTEKVKELNKKIEEYKNSVAKTDDMVALIKKDLDESNILAGITSVKGPGIKVTLDDTKAIEEINQLAGYNNPNIYIIHDKDILSIINELSAAGAEAFSVNGQRILANTAIRCVGPLIQINGVNLQAPYEISAIGKPETMMGALNLRGGIVSEMRTDNIDVVVESFDEIIIPEYTGLIDYKYVTPVVEVEE